MSSGTLPPEGLAVGPGKEREDGEEARDPGRAYARLTLAERMSIERGLDRGESMRSMASALGRAATTVSNEVRRNRTVAAPRERAGERCPRELPEGACPLLLASPWVCNACRKRRYGCSRRPKVEYSAKRAQALADEGLSASRRGVDETEESMVCLIASRLRVGTAVGILDRIHPTPLADPSPRDTAWGSCNPGRPLS
jgi:hypothetical protein